MDKQDELAKIVCDARHPNIAPHLIPKVDKVDHAIAAAVRSFMGSPELVDRVAAVIDEASSDIYNMCEFGHPFDFDELARAALSAAIGEQEVALRSPDA